MVAAGALRDPDAVAILGFHARPLLPLGQIDLVEVPAAAADAFDVTLSGASAHGAYPHQGVDALFIACQVVCALQQVVSRQVPAQRAAVVTIGAMGAGSARNVLAGSAWLRGTIRTRLPEVRRQVIDSVEKIVVQTSQALGGSARMELLTGYPRVRNYSRLLRLVRRIGCELFGPDQVVETREPTMGADDFSYYLSEQGGVPGCMIGLGWVASMRCTRAASISATRRSGRPWRCCGGPAWRCSPERSS